VEYDLVNSSMTAGVIPTKVLATDGSSNTSIRIESWTLPTCVLWHPKRPDDVEDKFLIVSSDYKIKEFNAESKQCRKTCLAPRYGSVVDRILLLPKSHSEQGKAAYVFGTSSRIVGMGLLPIDGDPTKLLGIVAHPGEISAMAVSNDGRFVFTAGGNDLTANMWSVTLPDSLHVPEDPYAPLDIAPFLDLLEGGPGGELHQNLIDYFYYCQLRHGGENTIETRRLTGVIPLKEIPALMRSVGYYPSEEEVVHMIHEIRYKQFMMTGETQDTIGLEEFIRLYVNHRPVVPLERKEIKAAVAAIAE
jgi:cilia- and flagella-associated protein 251